MHKTVHGQWEKAIIGNFLLNTKEEMVENIRRIWEDSNIGLKTNVALVYPIAIAEGDIKTVSLSSSHVISKECSPEEIFDWIHSLWQQKLELYSDSNVSPIIAGNIKYLFWVKTLNRFSTIKI